MRVWLDSVDLGIGGSSLTPHYLEGNKKNEGANK
jgi:hypothetical protein